MNDTPLLKTPGEMISEARRAQGLTLAQLSDRTKIPPPVLAALEMDEYHKISGPLYIKSFLRTCALDLGLEPETVLGLYNKISGEKQPGAPGSETVWGEDEVQVSRIGLPWLKIVFIAGVVAVVVGFGLFALRGCGSPERSPENDTTASESPAPRAASAEAAAGTLLSAETVDILREEADDAGPAATPDPAADTAPEPRSTLTDTLALGWILSPDLPAEKEAVSYPPPVAEEIAVVAAAEKEVEESSAPEARILPEQATVREPGSDPAIEPEVVISGPSGHSAADGTSAEPMDRRESARPLVLGIACPTPLDIQVKRDDERVFSSAVWPGEGEPDPVLPPTGFEAGRAYRQGDRWVIYWDGEDHFGVILGRVSGVAIELNGRPLDISRYQAGKEFLVDAQSVVAPTGR